MLTLIGGGVTAIPYDLNAAIASTDILRDISNNGSTENYIGVEPTNLLNEGNPCIVDGVRNTKDSQAVLSQLIYEFYKALSPSQFLWRMFLYEVISFTVLVDFPASNKFS